MSIVDPPTTLVNGFENTALDSAASITPYFLSSSYLRETTLRLTRGAWREIGGELDEAAPATTRPIAEAVTMPTLLEQWMVVTKGLEEAEALAAGGARRVHVQELTGGRTTATTTSTMAPT
jgi:hypothetical protein